MMEVLKIFICLLMNLATVKSVDTEEVHYRHLPQDKTTGTIVDKIIGLGQEEGTSEAVVEKLTAEVDRLNREQKKDRAKIEELETKLEQYHDEIIVSVAEVLQARQRILENYDKITALEETTEDNKLAVESLQWTQKENSREVRRYKEYKEKAAKRFHQIENKIERLETQRDKNDIAFQNIKDQLISHTKEQIYLRNVTKDTQKSLTNLTSNLTILTVKVNNNSEQLEHVNGSFSKCCFNKNQQKPLYLPPNARSKENENSTWSDRVTNGFSENGTTDIDIVEFGSGDTIDEYFSKIEETYNKVGEKWPLKNNDKEDDISLEYESSGETGSGETDELPPNTQDKHYIEKQVFLHEIGIRDQKIIFLSEMLSNLSNNISKIETKITSIQLGSIMQNLQESLINFTQNVITLDQWKISSNQMVNSTLQNQDQILELSNRIVENSDKISDLNWKMSSHELLSDRQYNILRMYIIRLNNTVEDIKEKLKEVNLKLIPQHQEWYKSEHGNKGTDPLVSKVENLALQVVYNQNRLGNLEVKILNETLYQCRKYNIDTFQDEQLASHEAIIRSNGNSIVLVHELVKAIDDSLRALNGDVKMNMRRIRSLASNLGSYKGIVPVVINMQKEIDNFRFQLPKDCQDYYTRGYRLSDVYVIHPVGSKKSLKVKCHMTNGGGWTVLQQRFDGSTDFRQNWTEYKNGFGEPEREYWIGNEAIHLLTANQNYSLLIEMTDSDRNKWIASYGFFSVSSLENRYSLTVDGYQGNATDGMGYSNNMGFSAPDLDNDASSTHCAYYYEVGWWYKHCQTCNLNGRYNIGFVWFNLDFNNYLQLTHSIMKIKPN